MDADRDRHVRRDEAPAFTITSLMPPCLANTFSEEELLDFVAWMERGGPAQGLALQLLHTQRRSIRRHV